MVIRAILDKRRANKDGLFPVKIRISDKGAAVHESTGIYAKPDEFDEHLGIFILNRKTNPQNRQNNILISALINKANDILFLYKREHKHLSPDKLKKMLFEKEEKEAVHHTFSGYYEKFTAEKSGRTKDVYQTTLKKIESYFGKNIEFEEITYTWLSAFERKMKTEPLKDRNGNIRKIGIETNSRSIHFRNIRAVFNDAINNEIISLDLYPFRRFKIGSEQTRKRAIAVEQLRKLFNYSGDELENFAVDMSKLIFFLIGINVKDLHSLNEYEGGYIHYRRAKTGALYTIKVEPETKVLLDKYRARRDSFPFRINTNCMNRL
jgi:hypothetical protein